MRFDFVSFTLLVNCLTLIAPQSLYKLSPSGSLLITLTAQTNSQNKFGATPYVAPFPQSKTTFNLLKLIFLDNVSFKDSEYGQYNAHGNYEKGSGDNREFKDELEELIYNFPIHLDIYSYILLDKTNLSQTLAIRRFLLKLILDSVENV